MKVHRGIIGVVIGMVTAVLTVSPAISAPKSGPTGVAAEMVITAQPAAGARETASLEAGSLTVQHHNLPIRVISLQRLPSDLRDMQLFIFLDDSTRSSSLGTQMPELKAFLASLPPSTQVAIGYMRNGSFALAQPFTVDHQQALRALRLPMAVPGANGSPYFALSDLAKHWPSKQPAERRAVLMLTDGVDRYYGTIAEDDPYVDASIHDALKNGVMVFSIYVRDAGAYDRRDWVTVTAQSRLMQVSEQTGGYAYFEAFTDPVTIAPFLSDFQDRLENQYQVTIEALNEKGIQPVKLRADAPGLKIDAPTRVYIR